MIEKGRETVERFCASFVANARVWLGSLFFPLFAFGVHEPLYLATAKEFSTLDAAMVSSPSTPQNDIRIYIVSIELIAK